MVSDKPPIVSMKPTRQMTRHTSQSGGYSSYLTAAVPPTTGGAVAIVYDGDISLSYMSKSLSLLRSTMISASLRSSKLTIDDAAPSAISLVLSYACTN